MTGLPQFPKVPCKGIERIADDIKKGKEEEFEFDPNIDCTFNYKLLARYSLPCKH
jgi:hypothetical protein